MKIVIKKKTSEFQDYFDCLSEPDQWLVKSYFADLFRHIALSREHEEQMRDDFQNALLHYAKTGVSLKAALERIPVSKLGGFYARPPVLWFPLDDAAKIYPLSMKRHQMAVFRLSVYMKEDVIAELLQIALTFTIKRFPSFATTVKRGFFWHYLDTSKRCFTVEPETDIPCRPLNVSSSGAPSFRVLYSKERISVEFFHILTDGTGGMIFLKTLTAEYLRLQGEAIGCTDEIFDIDAVPSADETSNDFPKAEPTEKTSGFMDKPAAQMSGRLSIIKPCQILHFELDSTALKAAAKQRGASVTAWVLSMIFTAQKSATDEPDGLVQIQVPVNIRKFYNSKTVRNFSQYCSIKLPLPNITSPDDILPEITRQLIEKASRESMNEMLNATLGMTRALRHVPLFIKRPVAGSVYGFLGDKVFSNTLSNLGVVIVPPEMAAHIEKFDFILSTTVTNRASCSMITFEKTTMLSMAKYTADPSFEEKLYSLFLEAGLEPKVKGSELYDY